MQTTLRFLLLCTLSIVTFGCASTDNKQSKFTADTMQSLQVGMSKPEVTAVLGEPRSRSVDNDGNEVWQYRQNGKTGKGTKTYADIMSFGLTSGLDSQYQDILTVIFKDGLVSKTTYEENVNTLSKPLGAAQ